MKWTSATKWSLYYETCVSDSECCRFWYLLGVEKSLNTHFLVPLRGQTKNSRRASPTFSYGRIFEYREAHCWFPVSTLKSVRTCSIVVFVRPSCTCFVQVKRKPYLQAPGDSVPLHLAARTAWENHRKRNDSFFVDKFDVSKPTSTVMSVHEVKPETKAEDVF